VKTVSQAIQQAEAKGAYVSSQALETLLRAKALDNARADAVQSISNNKKIIVSNAIAGMIRTYPYLVEPGGNCDPQLHVATCLRDVEFILRFVAYALLAGDASVLDDYCLSGLKETYKALEVPTIPSIRAIQLMKDSVVKLIGDPEIATEAASYFDRVIASLEEAPQPLWKKLVAIGSQVPEEEWAKLPTDLSRNFEHYMYGAPIKE
jgi:phycoerythrin beta chain